MQVLLNKIINDKNNQGLYLINSPTGSSKSYSSVQVMKKNIDNPRVTRFIFMTNNLNNLPMGEFKKAFGDDFEKYVIRLKNASDNILDHLEPFIRKYDYKYKFTELESYQTLKMSILEYEICKKQKLSLEHVAESLRKAEEGFRYSVRHFLEAKFKENEIKDKIGYVRKYYFELAELYPAIFLEDYKIICLSTNKFFLPIDIIYDKKISLLNSDLIKNSIIFIDEVDATKDALTNMLIQKACRNYMDYHVLAYAVSEAFKDQRFLDFKQQFILNAAKMIEDETKVVIDKSTNISKELYLPYSMDCEEGHERSFILSDLTYHEFFQNKDYVRSLLYFDDVNNRLVIKFVKKGEDFQKENVLYIPSYLRKIHRYLLYINVYLLNLAKIMTNFDLHKGSELKTNYNSLLNDLRFPNSVKDYYRNDSWQNVAPIKVKRSLFKATNSFYYRGVRLYGINKDLYNNRFNSSIYYHAINFSPEYLIMNLSSRAKVIGLSATCNFRTVYGNYNLDFLRDELNEDFHLMDKDDFERIKADYNELNKKYLSGEIKVHVSEVSSRFEFVKSMEDELEVLISKVLKDGTNVFFLKNLFQNQGLLNKEGEYVVSRYLTVAYVYRQFVEHQDMKSFLCLNNKLPKKNDPKFDLNILTKIFNMINQECMANEIFIHVLKSGDEFEMKKSHLLDCLSKGNKVFVISAYATIGAGQNMAYYVDNFDDLVNLVDFKNADDARNKKKDFDGIYLGAITNVLTLNTINEKLSLEKQLKFIMDLENLYENYEISAHVKNRFINNALMNHLYKVDASIINSPSARIFKTKQYTQAIGRLQRSFNKNPNIYVFIHEDVLNSFDCSILETEILSFETRELAMYVMKHRGMMDVPINYKLIAEKKNNLSKGNLIEILSNPWTEATIKEYEELGNFVLKHPTLSLDDLNQYPKFRIYYISYGQAIDHYYFQNQYDFSNTEIYFNQTKEESKKALEALIKMNEAPKYLLGHEFYEVSEDNARLKQILNYPGMKEWFEENGYATSFELNDFIINPYIYQAIYKGRLGEVSAKFILETVFNILLEKLNDEEYELFDFKYQDIYIDIKHWRYSEVSNTKMIEKIKKKMEKVSCKMAIFINLFDDSDTAKISYEEGIIQIPALLDNDGFKVKQEAILELLKYFGG